jgi:O-antigen ligase
VGVGAPQVLPGHAAVRTGAGTSTGALWWLAGLLALGAGLILATYAGREATLLGMLIAGGMLALVVSKPEIGVLLLVTNYLIASYPTPLRGEGLLTINNLVGILLTIVLIAQLAQHPDFWFLRARQLHVFMAICVLFLVSTMVSHYQFPDLRVTSGRFRLLDQTIPMARAFVTRVVFVVLGMCFMTTKRHIKLLMATMMICLIMVVPSALFGYATGKGVGGYRAAAEFSAGTNPNRLAFLCLIQMAFWWFFMRAKPSHLRTMLTTGVMISLIITIFLTASRSGAIGLGVLFLLLGRSRGPVRSSKLQFFAIAFLTVGLLVTVIPQENIERLENLNPLATGTSEIGSHSTERRVRTVELGWQMAGDYPLFGVGLGNFREVARQVYQDPFWRPPHNSYMWALSEGGIPCLLLYLVLFGLTWRDIRWLVSSPAVPHDLRWMAAALEPTLILLLFYSFFADIWLSPITYIVLMFVMVFKRYVGSRRVVVV